MLNRRRLLGILLCLVVLSAPVYAESKRSSGDANRSYVEGSYIVEFQEEPLIEAVEGLNDRIVRAERSGSVLRAEALRSQKREVLERQRKALRAERREFRDQLERNGIEARLRNEYDNTFNGIAVHGIDGKELRRLSRLPVVEDVQRNFIYRTRLNGSVPQVGAPPLWNRKIDGLNLTGHNITVAVVDTGVAYNHSDLGNCTTTEFSNSSCDKVIGGHDFVNDDTDPMDDNGHGTHVAATVAGNDTSGSLDGVAPAASIRGYKVLGSAGFGSSADIISGVEWAVANGSEVVSLSLGGLGNPDDDLSTSIDNAVENGTVAVVAAGNSGPGNYTIGSPGTARKAITVGATFNNDSLVAFSSRGPVAWSGEMIMKPSVVAPGVDICAARWDSAFSDNCTDTRHVSISGTSMATPHVSGSAALVLQANPSWTPLEVKSALLGSTTDIGEPPYRQGTGRINVSRAVNKSILTSPTVLNYGNVTANVSISGSGTVPRTVVLENKGTEPVHADLSMGNFSRFSGPETRDAASLNVTSTDIPAGGSVPVKVTLEPGDADGTYFTYLEIQSNESSVTHRVKTSFTAVFRGPPVLESVLPDIGYTNESVWNTSIEVENYTVNTNATVEVNSTTFDFWNDSGRTSGWREIDLNPGFNTLDYTVFDIYDRGRSDNVSDSITLDQNDPVFDSATRNTSIVNPPAPLRIDYNVSDDFVLDFVSVSSNQSDSFSVFAEELDSSRETCDTEWGIDCGVDPEFEGDNTFTACPTGEGTDESVRNIYMNESRVYTGEPVNVTVDFHVWSSADREYIWHEHGGDWQLLANESFAAGDHNVSVVFTPSERGNHTFRGVIDFTPEGDRCAGGDFFDNDDIRLDVTERNLDELDGGSSTGNLTLNVTKQEGRAFWELDVRDRAGNIRETNGSVEINEPPVAQDVYPQNVSFENISYLDQEAKTVFTMKASDVNSNIDSVTLDYEDPNKSETLSMKDIGSSYQVNLTTSGVPGEVNVSISVEDVFDRSDSIFEEFEIKDYVVPSIVDLGETGEILLWQNSTVSVETHDSSNLSEVRFATNETGAWENKTVYGSPYNASGESDSTTFDWSGGLSPSRKVFYRVWIEDRFRNWNVSPTRHFDIVNFTADIPGSSGVDNEVEVTMEKPFWVTVSRPGFSYTTRASEGTGSGLSGVTDFRLHSYGSYTVEVFENDSQGDVRNSTSREVFVNVTDEPVIDDFELSAGSYPMTGTRYEGYALFNSQTYNTSELRAINSSWSETIDYSLDIETETDGETGEVYNDTYCPSGCSEPLPNLEFNFTADGSGAYNLSLVNQHMLETRERNITETFYSPVNFTLDIETEDGGNRTVFFEGHRGRIDEVSTGKKSYLVLPDITEFGHSFSAGIARYASYSDGRGQYIFFRDTPATDNLTADSSVYHELKDTGQNLLYTRYSATTQFNVSDREAWISHEISEVPYSLKDEEEVRLYTCGSYAQALDTCSSGWSQKEDGYDEQFVSSDSFDLERSIGPSQAVAVGEPVQCGNGYCSTSETSLTCSADCDTSTSTSGSSGSSGGFSTSGSQDFNVRVTQDAVVVTGIKPGQEKETVRFQDSPVAVDEVIVSFSGDGEAGFEVREMDQPASLEKPATRVREYVNMTANGSAADRAEFEVGFNVSKQWVRSGDTGPNGVSMYRYDGGWQELDTRLVNTGGSSYRYRATVPGFSVFAIAADTSDTGCGRQTAAVAPNGTCRTFQDNCEVPGDWNQVDSCDSQDSLERGSGQVKGGTGLLTIIAAGVVGIGLLALLAGGGYFLLLHRREQSYMHKLEVLSEDVAELHRKWGLDNIGELMDLIDRAEKKIEASDYQAAEDLMDEIERKLE